MPKAPTVDDGRGDGGLFAKGRKKTGGRIKGTPNKQTTALKDMILGALDDAGGQRYLLKQATENPTAFLTLVGKVLPTTLAGDPSQPLYTAITRTIIDPKGDKDP